MVCKCATPIHSTSTNQCIFWVDLWGSGSGQLLPTDHSPQLEDDDLICYRIPQISVFRCSRNFSKNFKSRTRERGHGEETQLSSGGTLIGLELSSPNFNSSLEPNDRSRFVISM